MKSYTITVPRDRMEAWLRPALVCAGKDDMLPVLTNLHMTFTHTHALAVSTDRFRAAVSRLRYPDGITTIRRKGEPDKTVADVESDIPEGTTLSLNLGATAITNMLAFHRSGRRRDDQRRAMRLIIPEDASAVTFEDVRGPSVRLPEQPGTFPGIVGLVANAMKRAVATDTPAIREFGVSMAYLADFKAAASKAEATRIATTGDRPNDPLIIQPSEDFIGVLMRRRALGEDGNPTGFPPITDGWHDALGIPKNGANK